MNKMLANVLLSIYQQRKRGLSLSWGRSYDRLGWVQLVIGHWILWIQPRHSCTCDDCIGWSN